jgi:hypothetical protein
VAVPLAVAIRGLEGCMEEEGLFRVGPGLLQLKKESYIHPRAPQPLSMEEEGLFRVGPGLLQLKKESYRYIRVFRSRSRITQYISVCVCSDPCIPLCSYFG